ncbi:TMhelix containing protein [Vibrio phage 1.102.O._10N.261.45.E3]|uniref:TMhelix containing protein n=9 Tax=Autolykiviridae TaxID=2184034 RepID=A0A2I7R1Y1_9VIRU|nr:TMhelix containing protein [Vibrio phage 1.044.O._10N.261.51.B8]AUR83898.1 TMhelix containing protein [Vibrio phage 1.043.O._10N.261.52.C7]AUR84103.1 TMhelix containing protein [Vibrio phage 1.048.O._10N.286.46.A10]AUR84510.1 TMhelix containing protein [Vibrio phage 1.057.O._10N.261.46.B12]AUR87140.1 TMhelix containing protein [Vibrio phage 1.095.O._10N.286.46.E10]AUR87651.1 TMhelix containing protein [Vibrio phage 1.102.O._10N.261.45.E3]AUR88016.1 TMhelix containing protein [Vibrio phage 
MQAAGGGGMSASSAAGGAGDASGSSIGGVSIDLSGRGSEMNLTYIIGGAVVLGLAFIFMGKKK